MRLAKPKRSFCSIDKLLQEAVGKYQGEANKAGIQIDLSLQEIRIWGDPAQILEAFENVIENAIEAMPNGGRLVFCQRKTAGVCETVISDTGKGMAQDEVERIMGQLNDEARLAGEVGMGLFLTRLYCESHGGSLRIVSSPNQGTTVTVTLPIEKTEDFV